MTYDLQEAPDEDDGLPNQILMDTSTCSGGHSRPFRSCRGARWWTNTKEKLNDLQDAIDEDLYPNSDAYQLDALVQRQLRVVAEGFVEHWLTRVDTIEFPPRPTKPWRSLATFRTRTAGNWRG